MNFTAQVLFVVFLATFVSCSDDFPASIERCKNEDNECLKRTWNKYIKMSGSTDLPELNLPNLKYYPWDKMQIIVGGNGALNIKLQLNNLNMSGFHNFVIENITGFPRDPKSMSKFELRGTCHEASFAGKYKINGKLLLLPLTGQGDCKVDYYKITFKIVADTKTEIRDGEEYLVVTKVHLSYFNDRTNFYLGNLLNNKELSDSINAVISENQEIIGKEMSKPVGEAIGPVFKQIFNTVFTKYPYRKFFLEA